MSAYSDWKCGAITEEEYDDYCRWEDRKERALEEAEHCQDDDLEEEDE